MPDPDPSLAAVSPRPGRSGDAITLAALTIAVASLVLAALDFKTFALLRGVAGLVVVGIRVLYTLAPVVAAGAWLARRLGPRRSSLADEWLSAWALGWTAVVILGLVMLAAGRWYPVIWTLAAMIANLALVWRAARGSNLLRRWTGILQFPASLSPPARRLAAGLAVVGILGACSALVPPSQRDELTYHLLLPRLWDIQHHWWMETDNDHLFFPANAEIAWGYAATVGGSALPRIVVLAFSLSALLLMWEHARRDGCSETVSAASVAFFAVTPAALTVFAVAYAEWPLIFFVLMAWREIRRWLADREPIAAVLAAVSLGGMSGCKASALPLAGLLALEWTIRAWRRNRRSAIDPVLLSALGIGLLAGPWMIRNAIALGDPVHPLGAALLGAGTPDSTRDLVEFGRPFGWSAHYPLLFHAVADPTVDHRLHLGWALLVPLVMLTGWRRLSELPWLSALIYGLILIPFTPAPRIYLPLLTLSWLFLPKPLEQLSWKRRSRVALVAAGVALSLASLPSAVLPSLALATRAAEGRLLAGGDHDSFLRTLGIRAPVMDHVREHWLPDARIWVWCDDEVLYFDRWVRPDGPFAAPGFLRILRTEGAQGLDRVLRSSRIDLVAVRHGNCPLEMMTVRSRSRSFDLTPSEQTSIHQWMENRLQPVVHDDRYALYAVKP